MIPVQRFGNDHNVLLRFAVIQGVGSIIHCVAKRVEITPVGECGGEAQTICIAILIHEVRKARQYPFGRSDWILDPGAHNGKENCFRIGRPDTRKVEFVWNQRLHLTA